MSFWVVLSHILKTIYGHTKLKNHSLDHGSWSRDSQINDIQHNDTTHFNYQYDNILYNKNETLGIT